MPSDPARFQPAFLFLFLALLLGGSLWIRLASRPAPPPPQPPSPIGRPTPAPLPPLRLPVPDPASPEFPFQDLFRRVRPWVSQLPGKPFGKGGPLTTDRAGWIRRLAPGQSADALLIWDETAWFPGGRYLVRYQGRGVLALPYGGRLLEQAPGEMLVDLPPGKRFGLRLVQTESSDYLRGISVRPEGSLGTFSPMVIERVRVVGRMDLGNWLPEPSPPPWARRLLPGDFPARIPGVRVPVEFFFQLASQAGVELVLPEEASLPEDWIQGLEDLRRTGGGGGSSPGLH
jgi:hypothetical protein